MVLDLKQEIKVYGQISILRDTKAIIYFVILL